MATRLIFGCSILLILSGCAGQFTCTGFEPIKTSSKDKLTAGTATQLVAHNKFGERMCGWKP